MRPRRAAALLSVLLLTVIGACAPPDADVSDPASHDEPIELPYDEPPDYDSYDEYGDYEEDWGAPHPAEDELRDGTDPDDVGTRVGSICEDGSESDATGRGACSWHGGVDQWVLDDGTTIEDYEEPGYDDSSSYGEEDYFDDTSGDPCADYGDCYEDEGEYYDDYDYDPGEEDWRDDGW